MEFTKEKTNVAKGVAICLMFSNHLYAFPDRLLNGNSYIPLIPFLNLESYVGRFGTVCVAIFLFLSGYGMFLGYSQSQKTLLHYLITKLKSFYLTYWLYFLIFVPIGIFCFPKETLWQSEQLRYSAAPIVLLRNFVGWDATYNQEWWFVRMFVLTLLFLFPLYIKLAEKNITFVAFVSLLLFALSFKVNAYGQFGFIAWQPSFALGLLCAKTKFFSSNLVKDFDAFKWPWVFAWLLLGFILRTKIGGSNFDFLIVAFLIYFSVRMIEILRLSRSLAYLGERSFPLWLIHSFFCYYYFQDLVYLPKWSPFVFSLLTVMSLLSVLGVEYLCSTLQQIKGFSNPSTRQIDQFRLRLKSIYRR